MKRRTFLRLSFHAAGLMLLAACQRTPELTQTKDTPRIAFLTTNLVNQLDVTRKAAFEQGLYEVGFIDGKTITVDWVLVDDHPDVPMRMQAEQLVSRAPQVVVVSYTPTLVAIAEATGTIPIVSVLPHRDLGELGLIQSDSHPGGNVTGMGGNPNTVYGKLVELLKSTAPSISRLGYLHNPNTAGSAGRLNITRAAANQLGLEFNELQAANTPQMESAFASAAASGTDGLLVESDLVFSTSSPILDLSLRYRLPTIYSQIEGFVDYGGLMAYSPNVAASHRRAASYIYKILKGLSPSDLPVEEATTFDFALNLSTARTLGLVIPQDVLIQATQVIQ